MADSDESDYTTEEENISIDNLEVASDKDDEISYQMIDSSNIKTLMETQIEEVSYLLNLKYTTVRLLLNHFRWDKELLIQDFYDQGIDGLLEKASLSTHEYMKRRSNYKDFSSLTSPATSAKILDNPTDPLIDASLNEMMECEICLTDLPESEMRGLGCDHNFCQDCWTAYLTSEITTKISSTGIKCPMTKCDLIVDDDVVIDIIRGDDKLKRTYNKMIAKSFVDYNEKMTWCPNKDCDYIAMVTEVPTQAFEIKCTFCEETYCFNCGLTWHEPVNCKHNKKWMDLINTDSVTLAWIGTHTKDCPQCQENIEKNGGCNHMTCLKCKHEFCWICMEEWKLHTTDGYNCNKLDVKYLNPESNREKLEYYTFHFERYMNHEKSMEFEKNLRYTIQTRMSKIKMDSEIFIDDFFINATIDILCRSRKVLKYTYVFSYYLDPISNNSGIFTTNQANLEKATEALSRLLEEKCIPTDIADFKKNVEVAKSVVVQRLKVVLDLIQEGNAKLYWIHRELVFNKT